MGPQEVGTKNVCEKAKQVNGLKQKNNNQAAMIGLEPKGSPASAQNRAERFWFCLSICCLKACFIWEDYVLLSPSPDPSPTQTHALPMMPKELMTAQEVEAVGEYQ